MPPFVTTTIAIALLVAGAGYLMSANLGHLAAILEGQVEVVGFLRRDMSAAAKRRLLADVERMPGVKDATIVGRADAMRRLQRTFRSMASINELLPNNPLPDSIEVEVRDARHAADIAAAHFQRVAQAKYQAGEPILFYGHPTRRLGRYPHVVAGALRAVSDFAAVWHTTLAEFARLLEFNPDYVPGYQMAAQTLMRAGRNDEARKISRNCRDSFRVFGMEDRCVDSECLCVVITVWATRFNLFGMRGC